MKRKLTDNIPLKIMSLAVGILVWLIVVNIDNPIMTRTFVIQNVELVNEAYIDNNGQMCMQEEEQQPVRVVIRGARNTINRLSVADIHAVADMQQALSLNDPVMVPITVTCPGIMSENIEVTPRNLSIHIQEKRTQEFVVNVTTGESRPGRGYEVGIRTSNPEKVKITGPASLIGKIDRVSAFINVEGITDTTTQETDLTIIDRNGDVLSDTEMNYLNVPRVSVTVRLWKVRSNVQLSAGYIGEPAEGYQVESVVTVPDVVSVAGNTEALEALSQRDNTIEIPARYVDISDSKEDFETKINLTELLPDNLKLTSDSSEDVFVRVNILPEGSEVYNVQTKDIRVENQPENMQVTFDTEKIEIRVHSIKEDSDSLSGEDIEAYIDLEGKEEGSYEVPVQIRLPKGYELVDDVTAEINVSEVENRSE